MDLYFLRLSWKNIWRNKRRTLLTVNAIAFGVMALVVLQNYYDGFHEQVIHNVIRYQSGHLVVSYPGYHKRNSTGLFLKDPRRVEKWLKENEAVKSFSSRVILQGLLSTAHGSSNVGVVGIEPHREATITRFSRNIIKGTYLAKTKNSGKTIVLGKELAALLKADLGTKIVLLTQGIDGSIGNELFSVAGIFQTQSEFDRSVAFVNIGDARQLLALPKGAVHQVAVTLHSDLALEEARQEFYDAFGSPAVSKLKVDTWKDLQKPIMAMIELNQSANRLLMLIILFVATLGIANAVLMSILERTREFGVMFAIGADKSEIQRFVLMETFLITLVGVGLGNLFGILLTLYFGANGFDLSWLTSQKIVVQGAIIQTVSYPAVHWVNSGAVSGTILIFSFFVALLPIRFISKLEPVKALRFL